MVWQQRYNTENRCYNNLYPSSCRWTGIFNNQIQEALLLRRAQCVHRA